MFKVIVNCWRCEDFIEKCLESLKAQSVTDWEAYVTVDAPTDSTYRRAILASAGDPRIHVKLNTERLYSLANQIRAIERSRAQPEDVIVSLDGDDWFTGKNSLAIIRDTYEQTGCWVTYGSWISTGGPAGTGMWPAYPDHLQNFRHHRWLATAVRTWKRWIWDRIDPNDLRDNSGELFKVAEDRAIMIPLLEMCGTSQTRHIPAPIMEYNQSTQGELVTSAEAEHVVETIERRKPYQLLKKPVFTL